MPGILTSFIEKHLETAKPKIGFGLLEEDKKILDSLRKGQAFAEIVIVGPESLPDIEGFEVRKEKDPDTALAKMLASEEVAGIVRGTIDDFRTFSAYQKLVGMEDVEPLEPGVLEDAHGRQFLISECSNPKGWSKEEKLTNAKGISEFLTELGITPKVGVLTGVRHETFKDQQEQTDGVQGTLNQTYADAEWVVAELKKENIDATNYAIDLSVAMDEGANIIITPNGMVGNQMFRALCLLGGGKVIAVPRTNFPHPYEENSRRETDMLPHVKWLVAWINSKEA